MGINIIVYKHVSKAEQVKEMISHRLNCDYEIPSDEELAHDLGEIYQTDECGYGHFIVMKNKFTHFISNGKYESLFDYCSVHKCRNLDSARCVNSRCPFEERERDKSLSDYEWLVFLASDCKVDYKEIEPCLPKLREFFKKRRFLAYDGRGTNFGKQFLLACEKAVEKKGWIEVC